MHKEKQSSEELVVKVAAREQNRWLRLGWQCVRLVHTSGATTLRALTSTPHAGTWPANTHTSPQHVTMQYSTTRYLRYPAARAVPQTPGLEVQQPRECRLR